VKIYYTINPTWSWSSHFKVGNYIPSKQKF